MMCAREEAGAAATSVDPAPVRLPLDWFDNYTAPGNRF
jgi:hypothetical protein